MKKIISAVTCLALALSLTVASVSAEQAPATVTFEGINYTVGENNKMAYRNGKTWSHFLGEGAEDINMIDVISNYKTTSDAADKWISTSYANGGFGVEEFSDGLKVTPSAKSILGGNYIQVSFTAKAETAVQNGKIGIFYDVEINSNDEAQLNVINSGNRLIGFDMTDDDPDSGNPKLTVYLRGKAGVTDVDTYWFGSYYDSLSRSIHSMETEDPSVFTGSESNYYYQKDEEGKLTGTKNADSAMTFSWQNINLAAGEEKTYSIIIGVGNANSEAPVISSVNKTDAGYVVKGTQTGDYEKQNFSLMYSIGNEDTVTSTSAINWNGDNFTTTIPVDVSKYTTPGEYTIAFTAMNNYGSTSNVVNAKFNVAAPEVIDDEPTPTVTIPEEPTPKAENPTTNANTITIASIAGLITICGGVALTSKRKKASK